MIVRGYYTYSVRGGGGVGQRVCKEMQSSQEDSCLASLRSRLQRGVNQSKFIAHHFILPSYFLSVSQSSYIRSPPF